LLAEILLNKTATAIFAKLYTQVGTGQKRLSFQGHHGVKRSRSRSDDHGNFLDSIAREPLKGFEKKNFHKLLLYLGNERLGSQGDGVKGQGHFA